MLNFLIALIPIVLLILLLGVWKRPAHTAAVITLIAAALLAGLHWGFPLQPLAGAALEGAALGLWPIMIVIIAAIFSYNTAVETGNMEQIKDILSHLTEDKRIHVLILAWGFGGFLEAVAGYGTAVAIPASILAILGFDPLFAAVICLIANTVPTAFGAIGIPVTTLATMTGLDSSILSQAVALQLTPFIIVIPFALVILTGGGFKAIKGVFGITLASGLAFALPQYFIASWLGPQLPALMGAVTSMGVTILLAKTVYNNKKEKAPFSLGAILKAWFPYILILMVILGTSTLISPVHNFLGQFKSSLSFLPQGKPVSFKWILTPGVLIVLSTLISGTVGGLSLKSLIQILGRTVRQLGKSVVTVTAIVALAKVMSYSGMISDLALGLVTVTGPVFPYISPLIGTLGTFLTGSDTSSNILFGVLQKEVAFSLNIDPYWLAAANTSGATAGKMISPQSIAVATSATGLVGSEGKIFIKTLLFCLVYVSLLGIVIGLRA